MVELCLDAPTKSFQVFFRFRVFAFGFLLFTWTCLMRLGPRTVPRSEVFFPGQTPSREALRG